MNMSDYPTLHLDIHECNGTAILFCIICSHHDIAEILLDFKMLTPKSINFSHKQLDQLNPNF